MGSSSSSSSSMELPGQVSALFRRHVHSAWALQVMPAVGDGDSAMPQGGIMVFAVLGLPIGILFLLCAFTNVATFFAGAIYHYMKVSGVLMAYWSGVMIGLSICRYGTPFSIMGLLQIPLAVTF
eukprot:Filipodium_phascolosomae@DN8399_c0_g2_i1.p1